MKMPEPAIVYGTLEQPIHPNGQYLLMKAGIDNETYTTQEFIDLINGVSLDGVLTEEGRRDVNNMRNVMKSFTGMGDTVTIKDFNPDEEYLEKFVNTTFQKMYDQLHGGH